MRLLLQMSNKELWMVSNSIYSNQLNSHQLLHENLFNRVKFVLIFCNVNYWVVITIRHEKKNTNLILFCNSKQTVELRHNACRSLVKYEKLRYRWRDANNVSIL